VNWEQTRGKLIELGIMGLPEQWQSGANLYGANLREADLREADLCGANLYGANLREADLSDANLCRANLCRANLYEADLREADLCDADLCGANLSEADLCRANLCRANLCRANLRGANLCGAKWDHTTIGIAPAPEGTLIVYGKKSGRIVKMRVDETIPRSWATTRKLRCREATVMDILGDDKSPIFHQAQIGPETVYAIGEVVRADDWCEDRWVECGHGIHCFISQHEAEEWRW